MQKAGSSQPKVLSGKVSAEASKAAEELESYIKILENFKKYEPRRGKMGCDIIGNFTQGMHSGTIFQQGADLKKAQEGWNNFRININTRYLSDKIRAGDIDDQLQGRPEADKTVNRWKYFEQKLRADNKEHLADALVDTLGEIVRAFSKLGTCLGK
jgi:hypothetical protein